MGKEDYLCTTLALRGQTPNAVAVVLIVVTGTRVHVRTIQVQVVRIEVIERRRRPIVPVSTSIVGGRRIEVAGIEEVNWELTPTQRSLRSTLVCTCTTNFYI